MRFIHIIELLWAWLSLKQAIVMLIITSGVKTLPPPGTPFRFFDWFYDWSHQFLNITNTRLAKEPIKTPPESPGDTNAKS